MILPASSTRKTLDGNEAVASVAYRLSEWIPIYPITPSTSMAELCDEWSAAGQTNIWGSVPQVIQMQSEAGAAGTLHGTAMAGALSTSFTASQGLLLMIPNMYKLAGELTPVVLHVSARAVATSALSIFGDHSDVMGCRQTGFAMLASASVQEAQDMAAIAHVASLESRIPFLHFFDGFRTSHELNSIDLLGDAELRALVPSESIAAFRARALTPDNPTVRGTAQNPDTYFQAREAVNAHYAALPDMVQGVMDRFAALTGRQYRNFEYTGHPEAEKVVVIMGSGAQTAETAAAWLNRQEDDRCGVLTVRLYRPFRTSDLARALPASVKRVAVLDRTKEPGSIAEPLCLDVAHALTKAVQCGHGGFARAPLVVGGRYGIGSKEFTPAMAVSVFRNLSVEDPKDHFTIGILDDVTHRSLDWERNLNIGSGEARSAVFYGIGSDGTVGANKNSIKIIGEGTSLHTQAYFVYDSKKAGGLTTSHLRYGPEPIKAPYLVEQADFVACHQPQFLERVDLLGGIAEGGIFLLNHTESADRVWEALPRHVQEAIIAKRLRFHVIDAFSVAEAAGLGRRINTIMQVAYFALAEVMPIEEAIEAIKESITKSYGRKGPDIVRRNHEAVDGALAALAEVRVPASSNAADSSWTWVPEHAPDFVKRVTSQLLAGRGDLLPVSAFPVDGSWPTATSRYEKRRIATHIPVWDSESCTQCNKCTLFCPHAAIRSKVCPEEELAEAGSGLLSAPWKGPGAKGQRFVLQVYPEDCTGCSACVELCPASSADGRRAIEMEPIAAYLEQEQRKLAAFEQLSTLAIDPMRASARTLSLRPPLFEFSGACSGCTQTPYVRILTQLFGDRLLIANATGCSSIYGGNLPTTPYCTDTAGRGPAWANSLFEDNAEFGLGLHLAASMRTGRARALLAELAPALNAELVAELRGNLASGQSSRLLASLREQLAGVDHPDAAEFSACADYLLPKTTWIVGGDGWAYDIGFGGLDHVLASGRNVNILVLDTEVYSNTGGQSSKATPIGATAKFAAAGKQLPKKNLGQIAMSYGGVYVGQIALGANEQQAIDVIREAEAFDGPSLVIAYGPCQAHGIDLAHGPARQRAAVESGYWPLYRHDPGNASRGLPVFRLDSFEPSVPLADFMRQENRFRVLERTDPERAGHLLELAQAQVSDRWATFERMAAAALVGEEDDDEGWG